MARMHGAGAGTGKRWQIKSRKCCNHDVYLLLNFGSSCPADIIWRSMGMGWAAPPGFCFSFLFSFGYIAIFIVFCFHVSETKEQ